MTRLPLILKIISLISLSNWNLGHYAPQEDSYLYNQDVVWTFKGSKSTCFSNTFATSKDYGMHLPLILKIISLIFCSCDPFATSSPAYVLVTCLPLQKITWCVCHSSQKSFLLSPCPIGIWDTVPPQEDGYLYNQNAIWTFKRSKSTNDASKINFKWPLHCFWWRLPSCNHRQQWLQGNGHIIVCKTLPPHHCWQCQCVAALLLVANSLPQCLALFSFQSQCEITASCERKTSMLS